MKWWRTSENKIKSSQTLSCSAKKYMSGVASQIEMGQCEPSRSYFKFQEVVLRVLSVACVLSHNVTRLGEILPLWLLVLGLANFYFKKVAKGVT